MIENKEILDEMGIGEHIANNPRCKKILNNILDDKKRQNPNITKEELLESLKSEWEVGDGTLKINLEQNIGEEEYSKSVISFEEKKLGWLQLDSATGVEHKVAKEAVEKVGENQYIKTEQSTSNLISADGTSVLNWNNQTDKKNETVIEDFDLEKKNIQQKEFSEVGSLAKKTYDYWDYIYDGGKVIKDAEKENVQEIKKRNAVILDAVNVPDNIRKNSGAIKSLNKYIDYMREQNPEITDDEIVAQIESEWEIGENEVTAKNVIDRGEQGYSKEVTKWTSRPNDTIKQESSKMELGTDTSGNWLINHVINNRHLEDALGLKFNIPELFENKKEYVEDYQTGKEKIEKTPFEEVWGLQGQGEDYWSYINKNGLFTSKDERTDTEKIFDLARTLVDSPIMQTVLSAFDALDITAEDLKVAIDAIEQSMNEKQQVTQEQENEMKEH